MPTVTDKHRGRAEEFAGRCWKYFVHSEDCQLDIRKVNSLIASLASDMRDVAPLWELTTTRYNEKVIRSRSSQDVADVRSFVVDLNDVALNSPHDDKEAFIENVSRWIIRESRRLAEEEESRAEMML